MQNLLTVLTLALPKKEINMHAIKSNVKKTGCNGFKLLIKKKYL